MPRDAKERRCGFLGLDFGNKKEDLRLELSFVIPVTLIYENAIIIYVIILWFILLYVG